MKKINQDHRKKISLALKGNKFALGKNLGENNGNWKGGKQSLIYKEKVAGREKPNACEVCYTIGGTDFDHCHITGEFRGWICRRCNLVLGMVRDSTDLLKKLANYLKFNSEESRPKVILNLSVLLPDNSHEKDSEPEEQD